MRYYCETNLFVLLLVSLRATISASAVNDQSYIFYNGAFSLSPSDPTHCYYRNVTKIENSAGIRVTGSVSVLKGVADLFIMTTPQMTIFRSMGARTCEAFRPDAAFSAYNLQSNNTISFVLPNDGRYYFLLFNPSNLEVTGRLTLTLD